MAPHRKGFTPLLFSTTISFYLLQAVEARSKPPASFQIVLKPIHAATVAFALFFCFLSLLQALAGIGKLGGRSKLLPSGEYGAYSTGRLYPFLLTFAALSLIPYYILSAITIFFTFNRVTLYVKAVSSSFIAGRTLVLQLSHWFIVSAMLTLIFHRQQIKLGASSMGPYRYKAILDILLLCALLGIILGSAILQANQQQDAIPLSHAYVALHVLLTIDVVLSAFWTWSKLKKESSRDLVMVGQIVEYISPLLVLQTVHEIIQHAIQNSATLYTGHQTADALLLTRILVVGTTNFLILWFAL